MPATWTELRGCLASLLDWYASAPSAATDMVCSSDAFQRWQALTDDLSPLPPDDAERTELLG